MIEATLAFITPAHLALVPVVIGVSGLFKLIPKFNTAYTPFVALVVGIGLAATLGGGLVPVIIGGIVMGLMASGLYSGTAAIKNNIAG
jgi:hypothetical protein